MTITSYVHQGRHVLKKWILDPRIHGLLRAGAHVLGGLILSAASLGRWPQPLAMGLICGSSGLPALLTALGSAAGYLLFWGNAGKACLLWVGLGLPVGVLLSGFWGRRDRQLLVPCIASTLVAGSWLMARAFWGLPGPEVGMYILQILLAGGSTWLFGAAARERDPIVRWMSWGLGILALAQVSITPWIGLGFLAAGAVLTGQAFPAVALAGLALDLAQVTPVPMTAVMTLGYGIRLLPGRNWRFLVPAMAFVPVMLLTERWDLAPLPGLLLGGALGLYIPGTGASPRKRGEIGVVQVRLEMVSGMLGQAERLLADAPELPIDEDALVLRAAERACGGCPCRSSCPDSRRIGGLSPNILQKPLLNPQELPIVCRKSGRFLAELHRAQEQLRSIRADRQRQREYRAAVVQQYRFLSSYLQELADSLPHRRNQRSSSFEPEVFVYGNRPEQENGDRCMRFAGTGGDYYVLLCDGMGTGPEAVREAAMAAGTLKKLLAAGYPAEHALRSLNSLCALRDRAGAVTVDLARVDLNTGRLTLYKWGAAPSYVVSPLGVRTVGSHCAPPGISVGQEQEHREQLTLRREELLVMVSDGVAEGDALRCCLDGTALTPGELATQLIQCARLEGQDDATALLVRLKPRKT